MKTDKQINDGGPAFPQATVVRNEYGRAFQEQLPGMSLRDWFAGQALAGRLIEPESSDIQAAAWAYGLADAMLTAREAHKCTQ